MRAWCSLGMTPCPTVMQVHLPHQTCRSCQAHSCRPATSSRPAAPHSAPAADHCKARLLVWPAPADVLCISFAGCEVPCMACFNCLHVHACQASSRSFLGLHDLQQPACISCIFDHHRYTTGCHQPLCPSSTVIWSHNPAASGALRSPITTGSCRAWLSLMHACHADQIALHSTACIPRRSQRSGHKPVCCQSELHSCHAGWAGHREGAPSAGGGGRGRGQDRAFPAGGQAGRPALTRPKSLTEQAGSRAPCRLEPVGRPSMQ